MQHKVGRAIAEYCKDRASFLRMVCGTYGIFLVGIYIFAFSSGGYTTITEIKYTLFLVSHIALIYILLVLVAEKHWHTRPPMRMQISAKMCRTALRNPNTYFLLYLFFTGISTWCSPYSTVFWGLQRKEGFFTICLYGVVYLLLARYGRFGKGLLWVFAGSMVLYNLLGWVQLMGWNPFTLYPEPYNFYDAGVQYGGQYWSTIGNTNLCSAVLTIAVGMFAAALMRRKQPIEKWFAIPLLLCVFSLMELNVEAGLVAMMVGLALLLPIGIRDVSTLGKGMQTYACIIFAVGLSSAVVFYDGGCFVQWSKWTICSWMVAVGLLFLGEYLPKMCKRKKISSKTIRRCVLSVGLCMGIMVLLGLYYMENLPEGFLQQAHEVLHGNIEDGFGSSRIYIWRQVLEQVPEYFWFGSGPDTLAFQDIEGFVCEKQMGRIIVETIDAAHNEYLNILIHQGIFAFVSYCMGIGLSLWRWWTCYEDDRRVIAGAGVCLYCIQGFFGISMYISAPFFWLALAGLQQQGDACREIEVS